jgi:hypothetical protein
VVRKYFGKDMRFCREACHEECTQEQQVCTLFCMPWMASAHSGVNNVNSDTKLLLLKLTSATVMQLLNKNKENENTFNGNLFATRCKLNSHKT